MLSDDATTLLSLENPQILNLTTVYYRFLVVHEKSLDFWELIQISKHGQLRFDGLKGYCSRG